ncbi:MAG: tetratricopeptide repeat protein [Bacteroidota bacterium]|nr:tetratricopeptide repeat protein [Bacteroidota bacterium]
MDTRAFLERANLLLNQGRPKEAEAWAKKALAEEPEDDFALSVLARCYLNGKEYDKGIETAQRAISIDPENSHYYYLLGYGYYHKSDRLTASSFLHKAIELNPYYAEYYGLLSFVYLDEEYYDLALQKANEGLAIDAENITCLNARSRAQNKLHLTEEAIATMQDTLSKDPDNEFTHVTIGWNYLEKGKHKEARHHFREALRIAPSHHNAKVGLKEALKSKIPPYRWLLQFSFWLKGKGKTFRWVFVISIYLGIRIVAAIGKENPQFETIAMIAAGCYFVFIATSWIIGPLANVFLLFHKDGKHALDHSEKWNAIAFIICVFSGILIMCLTYFFTGKDQADHLVICGFIVLSLCIPAGHMDYPVRLKKNSFSQWIAISMIALALMATVFTLAVLPFPEIFFVSYFLLFIVYTWTKAF